MSRDFQPSFYRWALKLPDSDAVLLLREFAAEIYRELGGPAIEEHIEAYGVLVAAGRRGGADAPPLREFMRAMGSRERAHVRQGKLREQAWLQARAEVFQQTGVRIPLPQSPESVDREQSAEEKALLRQITEGMREAGTLARELRESGSGSKSGSGHAGSGSFSGGSWPEKVPDSLAATEPESTTAGQNTEPPTNKQIKIGIRYLIDAQIERKLVEDLRDIAQKGHISRVEFFDMISRLVGQPVTA